MDENANIENKLAQQIIEFLGDYDEDVIIKTIVVLSSALLVTDTISFENLTESIKKTASTYNPQEEQI